MNRIIKTKTRAKKHSTRVDMTPMVDLAFLLLTFFILTTTLIEQNTLALNMPADGGADSKPVNNGITLILSSNDKIFYYENELKAETNLKETDFLAVREILTKKNKNAIVALNKYNKSIRGKNLSDSVKTAQVGKLYHEVKGMNVIIKYDSLAKYRNVVDMVDEMDICGVPSGIYAIVKKLETTEKKLLSEKY